jgi:Amt family ammonium transporter
MDPLQTAWLSLSGSMALLIPLGLGTYASGLSRSKNAAGAILRGILQISAAALAFWAVGAAVVQGAGGGGFGFRAGLLFDAGNLADGATFFYLVLVLIAVGPISAAMGERSSTLPICAATMLLGAMVVPISGYWAWSERGWLKSLGFVDVGGATVVHVSGGLCAVIGAMMAGARGGKYNRDGSANLIPGHNIPLGAVGLLIMLAGWVPYIAAASALHGGAISLQRAAINVILSGAAAALVSCVISRARYGKPDVLLTFGGLLGGIIAIAAAGGLVSTIWAVTIGAVAGLLVPWVTVMMDLDWRIDDPSGIVAAYVAGGAWGTLAAGIFAPGSLLDRLKQLGIQALGLIAIAAVALAASAALFALLKSFSNMRVTEAEEFDGLDLAKHDLNAYPDFQQTMIKSYHLRET